MTIIQTEPAMFDSRFPVYAVTTIDRANNVVTLRGSDGTFVNVALNSWGDSPDTQPLIGSKVQLLQK